MKYFSRVQKRIFVLLVTIAGLTFIVLAIPNSVGSENLAMIRMFEPDEAAILPTVLKMVASSDSLNQTLRNFVFYQYYFYGFPFFSFSAISILPLKLLGNLGNYAQVMLVLRQVVGVLPMLIALLLLVYMQDEFRTYRSIVIFIFLLSIPAVLANNFWWHTDSLVFLMVVLIIYFLKRDNLRFGRDFLIAAALTGCATATKLIGLFFFLTIGVLLILGFVQKTASFKKLLKAALSFIGIMVLAYLVSNPFLISYWARQEYQMIFNKQMALLSEGYGIVYQKGLSGTWPLIHQYYGGCVFILTALAVVIWRIVKKPNKLLHTIILTWFIPLSIYVIWFSHFKYQYWLPVALPLFSSMAVILPEKIDLKTCQKPTSKNILAVLASIVLVAQLVMNISADIPAFQTRSQRTENNPEIAFNDESMTALVDLADTPLKVYFDYRLYVPEREPWTLETSYDLLSYNYVQENNYDALLLLQQRISDYLDPEVSGINPQQFANSQVFYADANQGSLQGYHLVFRNSTGLVFVKDDIYTSNFQ
jgi:hypothetical protein